MKVSTKGRYGLRVMMELSLQYGRGPVLVEVIARNQNISAKYIHVLVSGLRASGLIRAVRGPGGGYELARPPEEITALQVINSLEGEISPVDCGAGGDSCERSNSCAAQDLWREVAAAMKDTLGGVTLAALADRQRAKQEAPVLYQI